MSLELRNGTCEDFEPSAEMTSPRAESERLMFWASFMRLPVTPLLETRSLPARSTSTRRPCETALVWISTPSMVTSTKECDLLDSELEAVAPTARLAPPSAITSSTWSREATLVTVTPGM